jgi:FkbM family methyltransferase
MDPQRARRWIRGYGFERIRLFRSKFKQLLAAGLAQEQEIEVIKGLKLYLDLKNSRQAFTFWHHEEDEAALQWVIRTLLPVGAAMIDCGANFGWFGMYAMHQKGARVIFMEPHPRLARQIQRHLDLNAFGSLGKVYNAAASDADGQIFLRESKREDGWHSVTAEKTEIPVAKRRLENILDTEKISRVDLLKVDTEGHDLNVLNGLGKYLMPETIGLINVEMGENKQAIWELLISKGYRAYASRRIYIDELRQEYRRGNLTPFFHAANDWQGLNYLWCGRDSACDQFMQQVVRY